MNFLNITESSNLVQHVSGPTHIKGNTLDLVFTFGLVLDNIVYEDLTAITDHKCIIFNIAFKTDFIAVERVKRSHLLNGLSAKKISAAFDSKRLSSLMATLTFKFIILIHNVQLF